MVRPDENDNRCGASSTNPKKRIYETDEKCISRNMEPGGRVFIIHSPTRLFQIEGALTTSQLAHTLDMVPHWIYDKVNNGTIQIARVVTTHLYLFLDEPATLGGFKLVIEGTVMKLNF